MDNSYFITERRNLIRTNTSYQFREEKVTFHLFQFLKEEFFKCSSQTIPFTRQVCCTLDLSYYPKSEVQKIKQILLSLHSYYPDLNKYLPYMLEQCLYCHFTLNIILTSDR